MNGTIDILNCGAGYLEITFTAGDAIETTRAKRIITDMIKRGYALFIHGKDNALIRVKKFDAKTERYIIADGPTVPAEAEPVPLPAVRGKKERTISMHKAKATVVGRSAGG